MDTAHAHQSGKTGIVTDPIYTRHLTGPGHPESPARIEAVVKGLAERGLFESLVEIEARPADDNELCLCHTREYVQAIKAKILSGISILDDGDTRVCQGSWDVALHAAGGILNAVGAVIEGTIRNAFCAVRPPGHHANATSSAGFCILNNVAIAARYAQKKYQLDKVLIVDWDVHHGNGTQDIFYEDGSVFFFSIHQSPWYPGTGMSHERGKGQGQGTTLNCPLPAGSGRREVFDAFNTQLVPAAEAFNPDIVFISAGFDSRIGDPLGEFQLTDEDFVILTETVMNIADKCSNGRVVSVMEGGYNLKGLADAVCAHVGTLIGSR